MIDGTIVPICSHPGSCGAELLLHVKETNFLGLASLNDGGFADGFHSHVIPNHGE
jgi:hypothetical protein